MLSIVTAMILSGIHPGSIQRADVQEAIQRRTTFAARNPSSNTRSATIMSSAAVSSVLADLVVEKELKAADLPVTDQEAMNALLPYAAEMGLVDAAKQCDLLTDTNVKKWLDSRGITSGDLLVAGKSLAGWAKIATRKVTVSGQEVKDWVTKHPNFAVVPVRIVLQLDQVVDSSGNTKSGSRSAMLISAVQPPIGASFRGALDKATSSYPEDLKLYLRLDKLTPVLRQALGGKKPGESFGPVRLANGLIVSGKVSEILPEVQLVKGESFWRAATLQTALAKVDQWGEFERYAKSIVEDAGLDPQVRGIFRDALRKFDQEVIQPVKNYVKANPATTVATIGGAVIGGLAMGDPYTGAQYGFGIGQRIDNGGFWSNTPPFNGSAPSFNQAPSWMASQSISPMRNNSYPNPYSSAWATPPFAPPPFAPPQFVPYMPNGFKSQYNQWFGMGGFSQMPAYGMPLFNPFVW